MDSSRCVFVLRNKEIIIRQEWEYHAATKPPFLFFCIANKYDKQSCRLRRMDVMCVSQNNNTLNTASPSSCCSVRWEKIYLELRFELIYAPHTLHPRKHDEDKIFITGKWVHFAPVWSVLAKLFLGVNRLPVFLRQIRVAAGVTSFDLDKNRQNSAYQTSGNTYVAMHRTSRTMTTRVESDVTAPSVRVVPLLRVFWPSRITLTL